MVLGEQDQLQTLFWCDIRCQKDWDRFGDVLVFDSTYKTNTYKKPLLILSGVNNHFQTTIYAVAVLHDETTETFKWVLNCFMEAMGNKAPISVITDGDLAMKAAIAEIFPRARHRLCSWHLCRNAEGTLKLGPEFMKDFRKCWKKRSTINHWNDAWHDMVDKWNIADTNWIQAAYLTRHLWAETFLKETFFAGQTSTQRSESINRFFKRYLKHTHDLTALCRGFMTGMEKLRDNERGQHCRSDQGNPVLCSQFKQLEEHAALFYTRTIYFKFKAEAMKASSYVAQNIQPMDEHEMDMFYITRDKQGAPVRHVICYRDNHMLHCDCMKFESSHMICGHILYVLSLKKVQFIPENLLSKRWQKTDKEFYKNERCMKEPIKRRCDDLQTQAFRRGSMQSRMDLTSNLGSTSQVTYDYWREGQEALIEGLNALILNEEKKQPWIPNANPDKYAHVNDPIRGEKRSKGAPKKVPKRCGRCHGYGHNRTTCSNPPCDPCRCESQSQGISQSTQQSVISNSYYSLSQGSSHPILFRGEDEF